MKKCKYVANLYITLYNYICKHVVAPIVESIISKIFKSQELQSGTHSILAACISAFTLKEHEHVALFGAILPLSARCL